MRARGRIVSGLALGVALIASAARAAGPPPCPGLSPDAFAARLKAQRILPSRHFRFGGAHIYRVSGRVDCRMAKDAGGAFAACRFSSPVALQIATTGGRYAFFPGSGPATVTIRRGRVSCIMGG